MSTQSAGKRAVLLGLISVAALVGCNSASLTSPSQTSLPTPSTPQATATPSTSSGQKPTATLAPARFWERFAPGDPEEHFVEFDSLKAMTAASHLVVVGKLESVSIGPDFVDSYSNHIHEATVDVSVLEVIKGTVSTKKPGHVLVWALLGIDRSADSPDAHRQFDILKASLPRENAILFMTNTEQWAKQIGATTAPDVDPFAYQLYGQQGYVRNVAGHATFSGTTTWAGNLVNRSFDKVVAEVIADAH